MENLNQLKKSLFKGISLRKPYPVRVFKTKIQPGKASNLYSGEIIVGMEIDLIIEQANGLIPVEIKSAKTWNRDFFSESSKNGTVIPEFTGKFPMLSMAETNPLILVQEDSFMEFN